MDSAAAESLRAGLTQIVAQLPETFVEAWGDHTAFKVRKKTFAYFLANHHGDGIWGLAFKASLAEQDMWRSLDAERYLKPAYIGVHGWTTLRLDQEEVNWAEAKARLKEAYRRAAPKTLARSVQDTTQAP
jgi:hypothetical protein